MKIGDVVRRHSSHNLGVVIKVREDAIRPEDYMLAYAKVWWMTANAANWNPMKALEVVSENR